MLAEISAALSAAKTTKELASALVGARDSAKQNELVIKFQSSLIDLQTKILEANGSYEDLLTIKKDIEAELMEFKDWEVEKKKHELLRLRESLFVYRLNSTHNESGCDYWLCPNCFEKRKKSLVTKRTENSNRYTCFECDFNFEYGHNKFIPPTVIR